MRRLLFASRPSQDKGLDVLLTALSEVRHRSWKLEIIGDLIDAHHQLVLEAQAQGFHVSCIGRCETWQVAEVMRRIDILVVPSRYENFGNVALEGMACGCLVIASRTGGLIDLVENGVTGWLTEPGNATDLAIAIDVAMAQSDWSEKAKSAAIEKAQRYSWDIVQKDTLELLNALITNGSSSKNVQ